MKIRLKKNWGKRKIGDIVESRTNEQGERFIKKGLAERVAEEAAAPPEPETAEAVPAAEMATTRDAKSKRPRRTKAEMTAAREAEDSKKAKDDDAKDSDS